MYYFLSADSLLHVMVFRGIFSRVGIIKEDGNIFRGRGDYKREKFSLVKSSTETVINWEGGFCFVWLKNLV